jgi:hypothetical protein
MEIICDKLYGINKAGLQVYVHTGKNTERRCGWDFVFTLNTAVKKLGHKKN